ncbi:hypothetical protein L2E82_24816 [Cichorium intybus]|uniref:Uncharacterized protein n=1 Tax=Cichorium intybus TaxID=13427 RepID=A0ACB9E1I7_CICIN|nr:hypothetical protein L2E82_24816 [Cichorium intybus]
MDPSAKGGLGSPVLRFGVLGTTMGEVRFITGACRDFSVLHRGVLHCGPSKSSCASSDHKNSLKHKSKDKEEIGGEKRDGVTIVDM